MGQLYDECQQLTAHIEREQLDEFRTMGRIAMKCGFLLSLIGPDEPDDPEKIASLHRAAQEVLDITL